MSRYGNVSIVWVNTIPMTIEMHDSGLMVGLSYEF